MATASSGHEALEKFKREEFDLVLTDQGMPRMSGIELVRIIRQIRASQPVILLAGFDGLMLDENLPVVDRLIRKPVFRRRN